MKHLISLILCFLCFNLGAQGEAANWYFGYGAGIKFNLVDGTISALADGQLFTNEGCTSISDDSGNLLFYTDGTFVWNKNHQYMANGVGLLGDASSTQSAIIVPKPNDPNIFYIFTVGSNRSNTGLHYSTVDMSQNGGLGSVTVSNTRLLGLSSEKVTAIVKDCISNSMWVVTFAAENGNSPVFNTFHAFEVSSTGVNSTAVRSTFPINISDARGAMKLSPDGTKLACANLSADEDNNTNAEQLFLYDFDTRTGKVSNSIELRIPGNNHNPYGLEFSPNSQLLYVHSYNNFQSEDSGGDNFDQKNHTSTLSQFSLNSSSIQNSQIVIDERQLYRGGLQLGPDGRIYRALCATYGTGLPFLGVIKNPNNIGLACNYEHNAIDLSPAESTQGLPPFIQSLFKTKIDIIKNGQSDINLTICENDTYTLTSEIIPGAIYTWTRDKVLLPETGFDLVVTNTGHYEVIITPNNGDCEIEGQAYIGFYPKPAANNHTLFQCDEDGAKDGRTVFNLNEANGIITNNATNSKTKFYTNALRTHEIDGKSYYNTSIPQTIYVEVTNTITGCKNISELILDVSNTDTNNVVLPAFCDNDGVEDGFHEFNLKVAEPGILNGIPTNGLNISFYETYNDALIENNQLPFNYTNKVPYSQTIYARVENRTNCQGISEIKLLVNKLPNIESQQTVYYCLNKFPETITLDAGVREDSPDNYTYKWSNGSTSSQIQVNDLGTYTVTVEDVKGCIKEKTIQLEPSNIATFQEINVLDVSQNNTVTVFVSGEGNYEYALYDTENNLHKPYQSSNVIENVYPGIYFVNVKDVKNNCGIEKMKVSVIGYPKFFTPNNDGVHDTWQIIGISKQFNPNSKVSIFNRHGTLLKEIDPLGKGWDGSFNGDILPTDDYWFSVTLEDGRIFKNHFTLKR